MGKVQLNFCQKGRVFMPELPEVETVVRGLSDQIAGKQIQMVQVRRHDLRYPVEANFDKIVQQQVVRSVSRRAKYILIHLSNGQTIIGHLGMSGRMVVTSNQTRPAKHDHVIWLFTDHTQLVFNDARRFGFVLLADSQVLHTHKIFRMLGPEPLTDEFNISYVIEHILNRKIPVKQWIMDNKNVVGIGNIYACEALFKAKILPDRKVSDLQKEEVSQLVHAIKEVLTAAICAGGSSLKDYVQTSGTLGYFQHQFMVYGRENELCFVCQTVIKRIKQSGRSSFYCDECQR